MRAVHIPLSLRWWTQMIAILTFDRMLRITHVDARPYYPPQELSDEV